MLNRLGPYVLGPNDTPENGIYTGDARELAKAIPDESVDLIFTDPPYTRKYLYLYSWLAEAAVRTLKRDAFLLTYTGVYAKNEIVGLFDETLEYFWDFISVNSGNSPIMWTRKIISRYKSILAYRRESSVGVPRYNVFSLWYGGGQDKRYHTWGQDESTARYYTDCFSAPNAIVWEPFCGGGTILAACKILDRKYLAFEIVPDVAEIARERVRITQLPLSGLMVEQAEMTLEE